jgi:hypothetical protein
MSPRGDAGADGRTSSLQERGAEMTDQWALFDTGMWLMFLVWGVAWHLCHDDRADGLETE